MFSAEAEPSNSSRSVPAPPSTESLPSPGCQMNVSLPAPKNARSLPPPPATVSLPPRANITSTAADGWLGAPITATPGETRSGVIVSSELLPMNVLICISPFKVDGHKLKNGDRSMQPARVDSSWLTHRAAGEQVQRLREVLKQGAFRRGNEQFGWHTRV